MISPRGAFGRTASAAVLAFLLGGCATASQPFAVALPDGYYIQRDRSSEPEIVKRGGSKVLDGPIAAYAVHGRTVVGCVGTWPHRSSGYPNEAAFPGSPDAKYFILDTESGELQSGLTIDAWKQALAARKIPQDVRITAPLLL
jgi:hypothetical protein